MKIRFEIDENINEDEIIIKCQSLNESILELEKQIKHFNSNTENICFYKNEKEYYISLNDIIFFETSDKYVSAHTKDDIYQIKFKLYELENLLANNFIRVSKSTILNINHIYSINHNITSSSTIEFYKSYKQVYVSRFYYKDLKARLKERKKS